MKTPISEDDTRAEGDADGPRSWSSTDVRGRFGSYLIQDEVGRGGQGVVYRAIDTRLGRVVALKILKRSPQENPAAARQFVRESLLAAKLDDPATCTIYEAGECEGRLFIAMRFVPGRPLGAIIKDMRASINDDAPTAFVDLRADNDEEASRKTDEKFVAAATIRPVNRRWVDDVVRIIARIARAVDLLHEYGIVHRDIKPANIMVTPDDDPVLMDFGVARKSHADGSTVTETSDFYGTPQYMAPELFDHDEVRVDRRSDVWSLGVSLYEALTLRRPFDGATSHAIAHAIVNTEPDDIRRVGKHIPRDLAIIVETALTKEPGRRYQSAAALAGDLEAFAAGRPIAAKAIGVPGKVLRWAKREPAWAALIAVLFVVVPVTTAIVAIHIASAPERRRWHEAALAEERDELLTRIFFELSEGDAPLARPLIDQVFALDPNSAEGAAAEVVLEITSEDEETAIRTLEKHRRILEHRPAFTILLTRIRRRSFGGDWPRIEFDERKCDAVDHYLLAFESLKRAERNESIEDFREAEAHALQAVLLSPQPRLAFHTLYAHIAGHIGKPDVARRAAAALLRHWPNAASANEWAAYAIFTGTNDYDYAVTLAERAIELNPNGADNRICLAQAYSRAGRHADAVAPMIRATELRPQSGSMWSNLGLVLHEANRSDEALRAFDQAIALNPDRMEAHWNRALVLSDAGKPELAVPNLREVIRINPEHIEARNRLVLQLSKDQRSAEAIEIAEGSVALRPQSIDHRLVLSQLQTDAGRYEAAMETLRAAEKIDPQNRLVTFAIADLHISKDEHAEAIAVLAKAAKAAPLEPLPSQTMIMALLRVGRTDDAMIAAKEAVFRYPNDPGILAARSRVRQKKGDITNAVADAKEAVRIEPKDAFNHGVLGGALYAAGDLKGSIAAYLEALELEPDRLGPLSQITNVLLAIGDDEGAASVFDRLRILVPNDPAFGTVHLESLVRVGNLLAVGRAIDDYRRSFRDPPRLHFALFRVCVMTNDRERARAVLADVEKHDVPFPIAPADEEFMDHLRRADAMAKLVDANEMPVDAPDRYALAVAARDQKRPMRGVAAFEAFREIDGKPVFGVFDVILGSSLHFAAGSGVGDAASLDEDARKTMREKARKAILRYVTMVDETLEDGEAPAFDSRKILMFLATSPDLADARLFAGTPGPETDRADWKTLWADIDRKIAAWSTEFPWKARLKSILDRPISAAPRR